MAKPRVFISSTFYDLRQIRIELDKFIEMLGFEPVRNEEGDIPYGKEEELQKYCYKEIENIDILISVIGGRYGSRAVDDNKEREYSVSQKELQTAIQFNKQVFIFIDKNVATEFETYLINRDIENVKYKYVDDIKIYHFINEIKNLHCNNNIKAFETAEEITDYLKEQFSGLFKQYFIDKEKYRQQLIIKDINDTAKVLHELVDYLKEGNEEKTDEIYKITRVNHPLVSALKKTMGISYNIYIEGESDLDSLFSAYGYRRELPFSLSWMKLFNEKKITITIDDSLFEYGKLKYIKSREWKDDFVKKTVENDDSNLPF